VPAKDSGERVSLDGLDPEAALRALLAIQPDDDGLADEHDGDEDAESDSKR